MRRSTYRQGRTRLGLLGLVSVLAAPMLGWPGATAFAASAPWVIQKSPDTVLPGGSLDSVSCSSAEACMAVGTSISASGLTATLAERWNGSRWTRQPIPNLPGVTSSAVPRLLSVSCPAAQFCVAVGGTGPISSTLTSAASEVWNGRHWRVQPVPLPAGSTEAGLSQVSCVSQKFCEAVGSRSSGALAVTLAEVWRGSRWRVQRSPSPFLHGDDAFSGASCVSAVFCEAVGYNLLTDAVFAERWNGTSWRLQALPATVGSGAVISCASAKFCEAVGLGAGRWNGTSWRGQHVPKPAGASFIDLMGVSCVSARFCDAVGWSDKGVAAVAWLGRSWRSQPIPGSIEASPAARFAGVWCIAADSCEATGQITTSGTTRPVTLAARWNGHSWRSQRTPAPLEATENSLTGVSCASASFCAGVGSALDRSGSEVALAEIWNGSSWAISGTPNPARAIGGVRQRLDAVSCVSAKFCAAVGESSANPGQGQTPGAGAEMWNGTSWRTAAVPGGYSLASVSCLSVRFCVAVGGIAEVDTWDGHSWSAQPSVANFVLGSVSCVSTHYCDAVGTDASGIDAEIWNGTTWQPQPNPPPPHGDNSIILRAVSCATRKYCVVVGNTSTDPTTGVAAPIAELWNGSTWAPLNLPANRKATGRYLNAVSCTSTTSCTTVGGYTFGTPLLPGAPLPVRTLAEVWDGTGWKLRPTPNPDPNGSAFRAVSCRIGQACTAVGSTSDLGGVPATLIEVGS